MTYTVSMSRISVAPVKEKAEARGIRSALQLSKAVNLSYPTVLKWWNDEVGQIDPNSLMEFAIFLECEPGELIKGA